LDGHTFVKGARGMNIQICAVGKMTPSPLLDLFQLYRKRIRWSVSVTEVEGKRLPDAPLQKKADTLLLLKKVPPEAALIVLDPDGDNLSSPQLASLLERTTTRSLKPTFLMGGPEGLDRSLMPPSAHTIAFGRATWPHLLARVMLMEQLYRAQEILSGTKYHRA